MPRKLGQVLRSSDEGNLTGSWYAICMSEQIAVRIPDDLAESLAALVSSGRFETKADAVRAALEALLETERRRQIGSSIADGYRRAPQQEGDDMEPALAEGARSTLKALDAEADAAGVEW